MKTLVYGIDGLSLNILKFASRDFYEYVKELNVHKLDDDTLGRGWSKIFTGKPPETTNAFFQMPVTDGTHKIDKNYSLNTEGARGEGNYQYVWDYCKNNGISSVFMNMPTCSPAPKGGGVFVSGIGGGRYPEDGFSSDMYYPDTVKNTLDQHFKLDERLNAKFQSVDVFCSALSDVLHSQTDTFLALCDEAKPQFGFCVNKVSVELFFLATYDLMHESKADASVLRSLRQHFEVMYSSFLRVVEKLNPDNIILVSDHGTSPYRFDFNVDTLLIRLGFLKVRRETARKTARKYLSAYTPVRLKRKIKDKRGLSNKRFPHQLPTADSFCFSTVFDTGNFCGVYVNDERFGGLAKTSEHKVEQVIRSLNETPEFEVLRAKAVRYEPRFSGKMFAYKSPEIMVEKPDDVLCQRFKGPTLAVNTGYKKLSTDLTGYKYPNSGIKSSQAILACNFETARECRSLCDVHDMILQSLNTEL